VITVGGTLAEGDETASEEDGIKPLPDRLVAELTAYRTLALREALTNDPDIAFVAALHALCLAAFYRYGTCTCLEITAKSAGFGVQSPGLNDTALAKAINERHEQWAKRLPENTAALWDTLLALSGHDRTRLFAHCAAVKISCQLL
jgi:ParB family chromosome partitioning protein